ncbi:MAG: O-antigen ligase family protein [Candidatus Woesebacteria bacterium]|nr:O-antigen ligase family protein [Candidatus Woesebacteria bacterium]
MRKYFVRPRDIFKYGIAAILIVIPLYPKFPFLKIPGTYVSIRIEDFLMFILALLFVIFFFKELPQLLKNRLESSILVFILIGFVSLLSAILVTRTVVPGVAVLHWLRRIEYFVPMGIGILYFKRYGTRDLEFFIKVLMITVFIAFIYGFGQMHFSWPVIITQNNEYAKGIALRWVAGSQLNSTFAGHYDLATFLVFTLPIFISLFFVIKGLGSRVSLAVVTLSGLWLLANTASRISIASYLLASVISLLLIKKYKAIIITVAVSIIIFSLTGSVVDRYTQVVTVYYQRIVSRLKVKAADINEVLPQRRENINSQPTPQPIFEDRSTAIRLNVEWPRALRAFKKNPLLGTGYSSITLATDNDFLRLLGEVGILGFLSFILIFSNVFNLARKILSKLSKLTGVELAFVVSFIGGLIGILVNAMFIDIFEASKFAIIFFLITGLFVSLARGKLYE